MSDHKRKQGNFLIALGLLLLAAALAHACYNVYLDRQAGAASENALTQITEIVSAAQSDTEQQPPQPPQQPVESAPEPTMSAAMIDGQNYIGILSVPDANILLPVISELDDAKLKLAPCRYAGSAGEKGFVIGGHNYKTHFRPLKTLGAGAEVIFTEMNGTEHRYTVEKITTLQPDQVEDMLSDKWDLTLFTCTSGGKARLAVRCTANNSDH